MGLYETAALLGAVIASPVLAAVYGGPGWRIACAIAAAGFILGAALVPLVVRMLGLSDELALVQTVLIGQAAAGLLLLSDGRRASEGGARGRSVETPRFFPERMNEPPLDRARPPRFDQLAADGAQKRVRDAADTRGPETAQVANGAPEEGVVREPPQERRVVVVEGEHEPQALQACLAHRLELDPAVGALTRAGPLQPSFDAEQRDHAVAGAASRSVARPTRGQAQGVGTARRDGELEHQRPRRASLEAVSE